MGRDKRHMRAVALSCYYSSTRDVGNPLNNLPGPCYKILLLNAKSFTGETADNKALTLNERADSACITKHG